ncbi:MAG: hypothetical protein QNJ47_01785 [Nostocaceae cyanobacterium]|nr:hypothetical protein [Nostocaceae cyanobacterium]
MSKIVGGEITVFARAFNILPALDQPYFVELEVIDNQLTGRFFDETRSNELFNLSATDDTLTAGVSGLAVQIVSGFDDSIKSTFDNFGSRSVSVPEPNSLLSLLATSALTIATAMNYQPLLR